MKLLTMKKQHKRSFYMPDTQKSSCCGLLPCTGIQNTVECPGCGNELHYLGKHPKDAIVFTEMDSIFVNDNQYGTRVRQAKYMSKYFMSKKHGKIVHINIMESFTYNWTTGRLYKVCIKNRTNKTVRDITYVCPAYQLKPEFVKKVVQMRAFYLLPDVDIIRDIEQSIGVKDLFQYIDRVFADVHDTELNDRIHHILYCLAYPKFTWLDCPIHAAPTSKFRKALKEGKRQKDLYGAFFNGNVGKSTIQFLNDPLLGKSKFAWSSVRFLSMFLNKDKIWGLINSGWIINLIDTNDLWYDPAVEKELTPKAVAGFTSEYGVDRFINHISNIAKRTDASAIKTYIRDSITMWKNIKKELPDWTLPRGNSLRGTHDNLARDSRKLTVKNEDIEYSVAENRLNAEFGNMEFVLPKDVHTIIDIGDRLDICVGGAGYTRSAVNKEIVILFGFTDDTPMVCLEIRKGKLTQAKMIHNDLAKDDDDVCSAIKRLCEENKIDHSGCYDMVKPRRALYQEAAVDYDQLFAQPVQPAQPLGGN